MSIVTDLLKKSASLFTGGATTVYKYLAIIGTVLSLCIGSYFYGVHNGSLSQKVAVGQQINKDQQKVITITKTQTIVDNSAVAAVQQKLDAEKSKTSELQRRVNALSANQLFVTTSTGKCNLSPDWVQLYNESVKP